MTPEERAVLADAVAKTLAPMRHGAGESYTIWNAEADEIVEKLFSPRVVPCSDCGGKKWICTIPDDEAAHEHNRCNHDAGRCPTCDAVGTESLPPLAVLAEYAETLRESLARMVRWTRVDAECMSTAELAEYGDDLRAAVGLLGETAS